MKMKTAIILAPALAMACLATCLLGCYVGHTYGADIDGITHWYNAPAVMLGYMTAFFSGAGFFMSWVMIPLSQIK